MARYFFNFRTEHGLIRDHKGEDLQDIVRVREEARIRARDRLAEALFAGQAYELNSIEVLTETGHIALSLPLLDTLKY